MTELKTLTVVIADDHAIVREGIAAICETTASLQVLGQCSDGEAALTMIREKQPDFALLDFNMPGRTGVEVVRELKSTGFPTKLMILSINRDEQTVREALAAGADAYLLKDGPARHLVDAIHYILDGGVYLSPLLKGTRILSEGGKLVQEDPLGRLSTREREVFTYLVNGLRAKDIASLLDISPKTVDTYRSSLMRKLNVGDLVGLVKFAIEKKLIRSNS